jgi:hypothetical protein
VPSDHDVVTAVFGAATGLSGFLLVFFGITISAFQSYSAAVPPAAVAPYRRAAAGILAAFLVGLSTAVVALVWLLSPSRALRDAAVVLFFLQLAAVVVGAVTVARLVLWR